MVPRNISEFEWKLYRRYNFRAFANIPEILIFFRKIYNHTDQYIVAMSTEATIATVDVFIWSNQQVSVSDVVWYITRNALRDSVKTIIQQALVSYKGNQRETLRHSLTVFTKHNLCHNSDVIILNISVCVHSCIPHKMCMLNFEFWTLTELHHFVTCLSHDPRITNAGQLTTVN